jgi:hypothetical protein
VFEGQEYLEERSSEFGEFECVSGEDWEATCLKAAENYLEATLTEKLPSNGWQLSERLNHLLIAL